MRKYFLGIILLLFSHILLGQTNSAPTLLYSFDFSEDYHSWNNASIINELDVSDLNGGLHFMHCILLDSGNIVKDIQSYPFFRVVNAELPQITYWFNGENEVVQNVPLGNGSFMLDVSNLPDGYNQLYVQCGVEIQVYPFIKLPQFVNVDDLTINCIIDNQYSITSHTPYSGGVVRLNLDVTNLQVGIHNASFQLVSQSGAATSAVETYFLRTLTDAENGRMKCVYSIDGSELVSQLGTIANGIFYYQLPVENLVNGLHHIDLMMLTETGATTERHDAWFYKVPIGGTGITQYDYWLNEKVDDIHSITLPSRVDTLQLITLLPIESEPIRSSCFQFEVQDTTAKIYAKNDIHFRFYDASGRFVDAERRYVDRRVEKIVTITKQLTDIVGHENFTKPAQNTINWYTMLCQKGDSVAFCSSQATSIQVFSPSGVEVYSTSGSGSIVMNGVHTREDGMYYIGIHDVTSNKSQITLNYLHLDKYAILDYDVHTVGDGGLSTITFNGNGFTDLYAVDLINLIGDTIHNLEIGYESNTTTSVMFDFTDALIGNYTAVFYFKDEIRTLNSCLTVEHAVPIEFSLSASFATQYLRSTNNTYTFEITNHGNNTAYAVPLILRIYTPNDDLKYIKISDFDARRNYKKIIGDKFTESVEDSINNLFEASGDLFYLLPDENTTYVSGCSHLRHATIQKDIRPNTTEVITVSISSSQIAYVYLSHPGDWSAITELDTKRATTSIRSKRAGGALCAMSSVNYNRCEQNRMMEECGEPPIYDVDCPPLDPPFDCPPPGGGGTSPVNSLDPNDIFGYKSESGSMYVGDAVTTVSYRIEFENDTTFATASAHTVIVKDTLDANRFELSSFRPSSIKIGEKEVLLQGDKNFIATVDMRPEIYAITQVEGIYNEIDGISTWRFTSLDPMTMEETSDVMQGFLPVNYDGSGVGDVAYFVDLKPHLADGTSIHNRASIVFDKEEPILTPIWTNIVDAIPPTSAIESCMTDGNGVYQIKATGSDNRSGVWQYRLYVQEGSSAPWRLEANDIAIDSVYSFIGSPNVNYGFFVQARDSAGNYELRKDNAEYTASEGLTMHYQLTVSCNEGEGNVMGSGYYTSGQSVTISAIPNDGYSFRCWDDGSIENPRQVEVTENVIFVALFQNNGLATSLDTCHDNKALKIVKDNQLIIIRNGKRYTITGIEL